MKKIVELTVFTCLMLGQQLCAQQDPQFTQYFDNMLFVNPAYAGSKGLLNCTAIHREQWVGFDGRPRSTTFNIHSPLKYESISLGLTAVNDRIGPLNQTMIYTDFSYALRFNNSKSKLAFGLKGGVNVVNVQTDKLSTSQEQDPLLMSSIVNRVLPNFGFGIYYHSPRWFFGMSSPKILESSLSENTGGSSLEQRHYFLTTGAVFDASKIWKVRPVVLVKLTEGAPLSMDLSLAGIYKERIWIGAMYRFGDSFGAFLQFQINTQFKVGFAYDHTITELATYNRGTYEMLLSYELRFKKEGVRSPRYF